MMHVFISGRQDQQGPEPRGAPVYLAIPRRNRSLPSNPESEMQPKPNPFKTRHLSILSAFRAPRSPISSFDWAAIYSNVCRLSATLLLNIKSQLSILQVATT